MDDEDATGPNAAPAPAPSPEPTASGPWTRHSRRVGYENARAHCSDFAAPPAKEAGKIIEDEDTAETVQQIVAWLDERKLLA